MYNEVDLTLFMSVFVHTVAQRIELVTFQRIQYINKQRYKKWKKKKRPTAEEKKTK
jgi:hypothetical protein